MSKQYTKQTRDMRCRINSDKDMEQIFWTTEKPKQDKAGLLFAHKFSRAFAYTLGVLEFDKDGDPCLRYTLSQRKHCYGGWWYGPINNPVEDAEGPWDDVSFDDGAGITCVGNNENKYKFEIQAPSPIKVRSDSYKKGKRNFWQIVVRNGFDENQLSIIALQGYAGLPNKNSFFAEVVCHLLNWFCFNLKKFGGIHRIDYNDFVKYFNSQEKLTPIDPPKYPKTELEL